MLKRFIIPGDMAANTFESDGVRPNGPRQHGLEMLSSASGQSQSSHILCSSACVQSLSQWPHAWFDGAAALGAGIYVSSQNMNVICELNDQTAFGVVAERGLTLEAVGRDAMLALCVTFTNPLLLAYRDVLKLDDDALCLGLGGSAGESVQINHNQFIGLCDAGQACDQGHVNVMMQGSFNLIFSFSVRVKSAHDAINSVTSPTCQCVCSPGRLVRCWRLPEGERGAGGRVLQCACHRWKMIEHSLTKLLESTATYHPTQNVRISLFSTM